MKAYILKCIFIISIVVLLHGCNDAPITTEPVTLKVWAYEGEFIELADKFANLYPHIILTRVQPYRESDLGHRVEITDWEIYYDHVLQAIDERQPDILLLDTFELQRSTDAGQLQALDDYILRESFQSETYSTALMQLLHSYSDEGLFALTDSFYIHGLFYNKTLLDEYHISYPFNGITWKELISLANTVFNSKVDEHIIGYFAGTAEQSQAWKLINEIALSRGLEYVNKEEMKVVIQTKEWQEIWEMVLNGYMTGAIHNNIRQIATNDPLETATSNMDDESGIYINTYSPAERHEPFLSGNAAFYKYSLDLVEELKKRDVPFEWGVVTEPVDTVSGRGISMMPGNHYSILVTSPHKEEAWDFIQYLTSETLAIENIGLPINKLPARQSAAGLLEQNYSAFYEMPQSNYGLLHYNHNFDKLPVPFNIRFNELANETFEQIITHSLSIEEALEQLQANAQTFLDNTVNGGN